MLMAASLAAPLALRRALPPAHYRPIFDSASREAEARNARQVSDARRGVGRSPLPSSTVRIVVADTPIPSLLSSPWMRR